MVIFQPLLEVVNLHALDQKQQFHKVAPLHNNLWAIPALHKVLICIRTDDG
jgi:hypothetical protein